MLCTTCNGLDATLIYRVLAIATRTHPLLYDSHSLLEKQREVIELQRFFLRDSSFFVAILKMANVFDLLPDMLLSIMGLLSLIRTKRFRDAFAATAAVFGMDEGQLYLEVELFVQEHWEEEFAALDVHSRGLQYFAGEAAGHRPNELLLEAACRLKAAQLTVWDIRKRHCFLYGHHGPMYTAAISGEQFIAVIGKPLLPVSVP
uniref:Rab-GAP TBC domain-containing protein n=1 Tax=Ascaris lumbricoides TaxID=6252 RepID=A0A0M3IKH9_ASCLU